MDRSIWPTWFGRRHQILDVIYDSKLWTICVMSLLSGLYRWYETARCLRYPFWLQDRLELFILVNISQLLFSIHANFISCWASWLGALCGLNLFHCIGDVLHDTVQWRECGFLPRTLEVYSSVCGAPEPHSPPTLGLLENSVPESARTCFHLQSSYSLKKFYSGLQIHASWDI